MLIDLLSDWLFKGEFILKQAASCVKVLSLPPDLQKIMMSSLLRQMTEGSERGTVWFLFWTLLTAVVMKWPSKSSGRRSH